MHPQVLLDPSRGDLRFLSYEEITARASDAALARRSAKTWHPTDLAPLETELAPGTWLRVRDSGPVALVLGWLGWTRARFGRRARGADAFVL